MTTDYPPAVAGAAPRAAAFPTLRLVHLVGSLAGRTQDVAPGTVAVVGRHPDCQVRFDHATDFLVSTRHGRLAVENGQWVFTDTGSTNGTWVDNRRVQRQVLGQGQMLVIGTPGAAGTAVFRVDLGAAAGSGSSAAAAGSDDGTAAFAPEPPPDNLQPAATIRPVPAGQAAAVVPPGPVGPPAAVAPVVPPLSPLAPDDPSRRPPVQRAGPPPLVQPPPSPAAPVKDAPARRGGGRRVLRVHELGPAQAGAEGAGRGGGRVGEEAAPAGDRVQAAVYGARPRPVDRPGGGQGGAGRAAGGGQAGRGRRRHRGRRRPPQGRRRRGHRGDHRPPEVGRGVAVEARQGEAAKAEAAKAVGDARADQIKAREAVVAAVAGRAELLYALAERMTRLSGEARQNPKDDFHARYQALTAELAERAAELKQPVEKLDELIAARAAAAAAVVAAGKRAEEAATLVDESERANAERNAARTAAQREHQKRGAALTAEFERARQPAAPLYPELGRQYCDALAAPPANPPRRSPPPRRRPTSCGRPRPRWPPSGSGSRRSTRWGEAARVAGQGFDGATL
jgi:hypothetical protein